MNFYFEFSVENQVFSSMEYNEVNADVMKEYVQHPESAAAHQSCAL